MRGGVTSALGDWGERTGLAGWPALAVVVVLGLIAAFGIGQASSRPDPAPQPNRAAARHDAPRAGASPDKTRLRNVAKHPRLRGAHPRGRALRPSAGAAQSRPRAPAPTVAAGGSPGPQAGPEEAASRPIAPARQSPDPAPIASPPAPTPPDPGPTSTRPRTAPAQPAPKFDSSGDSSGGFDSAG
jgi:hypothetical protein